MVTGTVVSGGRDLMAALMQIGELADRTGLSQRTIRHYEDEGLLTPSARSAGGFRLYSHDDLDRLLLIRRMKPLGFSLDEMRELLTVVAELAAPAPAGGHRVAAGTQLAGFLAAAVERREKLRAQLAMADEFIGSLRGIRP